MALLDADVCYKAMLSRDPRFDGRFFVGVKTTGIYCRPICPARPNRDNVDFYKTRLAAERAGYRPCLRCRPECAPGSPAWIGKSAIVNRALKLIGESTPMSDNALASKLGVSARHLRRLFQEELGRTPKQIADTGRLDFARKLLVETSMPVTDISIAAGFNSLRRFNDAMKLRFDRSPRELRRVNRREKDTKGIELTLSFRPPFDWQHLLEFHRVHSLPGIQAVSETHFERVFEDVKGRVGHVSVWLGNETELRARILAPKPGEIAIVVRKLRRMFDLDCDPVLIANAFGKHEPLKKFIGLKPSLRLPRGWDAFETSVAAILGQLVSVEQGARLVAQLIEGHGRSVEHPVTGETLRLFPRAHELAGASLESVRTTGARKNAIREFAARVADGRLRLDEMEDPEKLREDILAIKGLGPWTADYIRLRALGDADAFPGTDLILKRALEKYPKLRLEEVAPWRGYAAIHLWNALARELSRAKKNEELS